jgi:hypothetical protein
MKTFNLYLKPSLFELFEFLLSYFKMTTYLYDKFSSKDII